MKMKMYLFDSERVVYEGEGWSIITDDNPLRGRTYATHRACTLDNDVYSHTEDTSKCAVYGSICWSIDHKGGKCKSCGKAVPEGIQGLVVMMMWGEVMPP